MPPRWLALLLVASASALRVPARLAPPLRARPAICLADDPLEVEAEVAPPLSPEDAAAERGRAALEEIRRTAGVGFGAKKDPQPVVEPNGAPAPAPAPAGGLNLGTAGAALVGGGVLALIAGTVMGGNPFEGASEADGAAPADDAAAVATSTPREDS